MRDGPLCCELSEAAGEPMAATATFARNWLVLEVPGSWPRDVSDGAGLPDPAVVTDWDIRCGYPDSTVAVTARRREDDLAFENGRLEKFSALLRRRRSSTHREQLLAQVVASMAA